MAKKAKAHVNPGQAASRRRAAQIREQQRGTPQERGYDHAWRKIRAKFLAKYPWCSGENCSAKATQVDHVIAIRRGGTNDDSNLKGYCASCHSKKTTRVDGGGFQRKEES